MRVIVLEVHGVDAMGRCLGQVRGDIVDEDQLVEADRIRLLHAGVGVDDAEKADPEVGIAFPRTHHPGCADHVYPVEDLGEHPPDMRVVDAVDVGSGDHEHVVPQLVPQRQDVALRADQLAFHDPGERGGVDVATESGVAGRDELVVEPCTALEFVELGRSGDELPDGVEGVAVLLGQDLHSAVDVDVQQDAANVPDDSSNLLFHARSSSPGHTRLCGDGGSGAIAAYAMLLATSSSTASCSGVLAPKASRASSTGTVCMRLRSATAICGMSVR